MKFRGQGYETVNQIRKQTEEDVLDNLPILEEEREEARDWHTVKHEVSRRMVKGIVGRPVPKRASRVTPVRDAFLLTRKQFPPTYPKKLKTDAQKQKYLKELYENHHISRQVYADMVSVLKVKPKKKIIF